MITIYSCPYRLKPIKARTHPPKRSKQTRHPKRSYRLIPFCPLSIGPLVEIITSDPFIGNFQWQSLLFKQLNFSTRKVSIYYIANERMITIKRNHFSIFWKGISPKRCPLPDTVLQSDNRVEKDRQKLKKSANQAEDMEDGMPVFLLRSNPIENRTNCVGNASSD